MEDQILAYIAKYQRVKKEDINNYFLLEYKQKEIDNALDKLFDLSKIYVIYDPIDFEPQYRIYGNLPKNIDLDSIKERTILVL